MAASLNLGNLLVHLRADASQFNRIFGAATNTLKRFSKLAIGSATAGVVASVKAFASFDDAMTTSLAIMRNVSGEMRKQMEDVALTLSQKSVVSAYELAESYYFLASAGLDVNQSMAAMKPMMDFAIAGHFNMAKATSLATDAQSVLGLKVKDAAQNQKNLIRVTDALMSVTRQADAEAVQFAEALATQAASTMKVYNIALEEGVSVLAAFAEQGRKGAEAGTLFSRMLRLTLQGFRNFQPAWKNLNVDIFTTEGSLRHLGDILNDLTNAFKGMSPEVLGMQLDLLGFQARSQQAILPLLGMGDAIKKWNQETLEAQGLTKEIAEKQMESWISQLKILWNKIKAVAIVVGRELAPNLKALNEWFDKNEQVILNWALFFADRINFAKDVMFDFIMFMKDDFSAGMKTVFDLFIDTVEVAGRLAVTLAVKTGQGIWEGIKKGLLGKGTDRDEIEKLAMKLYREVGGRPGQTRLIEKRVDWKFQTKTTLGPLIDDPNLVGNLKLYAEKMKEAGQIIEGQFAENIFRGFGDVAKKELSKFVKDLTLEGTSARFFETYEKRLAELALKDKERVKVVAALKKTMDDLAATDISKPFEDADNIIQSLGRNFEKFQSTLQQWANMAQDTFVNLADIVANAFDDLSKTLTQMVMKGKADFKSLAVSILGDLMTMIIRAQLARAAMAAVPGFAQYFPGYIPPAVSVPTQLTPMQLAGAPHGGGLQHGGRVTKTGWAVVDRGEIFSGVNNEMGMGKPPNIIINNNTGQKMEQERPASFDGENWVANIVIKKIASGGPMKDAIKGIRR